jgi:hypothetical protein
MMSAPDESVLDYEDTASRKCDIVDLDDLDEMGAGRLANNAGAGSL